MTRYTVGRRRLCAVGREVPNPLPENRRLMALGHGVLIVVAVALGTAMSGTLARYDGDDRESAYFGVLGMVAIAFGTALLVLIPVTRRLMHGVR